MGLFKKRKDHWIVGRAQVVSVNHVPDSATSTNLRADVVVEAPGVPAFAMEYKEWLVSISKFPSPGSVLPVRINPDDHTDIEVLWDEVSKHADVAREQAALMAEMMRNQSQQQHPMGTTMPSAGALQPQFVVSASDSGGDPVERLEKLAKLHASGIIDDAQFAALREQILGQAGLG